MKNKKIQGLALLLMIVLLIGQLCPMMVSAMDEQTESETMAETVAETEDEEDVVADSVQNSETGTEEQQETEDQQDSGDQQETEEQQDDESVPDSVQEDETEQNETGESETETEEEELEGMESAQLPTRDDVVERLNRVVSYQQSTLTNPICGSIGGEWGIIGLARCGALSDSVKKTYLSNLYGTLEDKEGILDENGLTHTEYSRVTLALASIGMDATDVFGYNILAPLAEYDYVVAQGINGPIWALIALDSRDYPVPQLPEGSTWTQTTRENLIQAILDSELPGGGWDLGHSSADADMTGMALQALAPYCGRSDVAAAVDRGLTVLSEIQNSDGGFSSWGTNNAESIVQVITALSALNIPLDDARFVKDGHNMLEALFAYQNSDGSFSHVKGDGGNAMATEQCTYGLVAYLRYLDGNNRLYDMTDVQSDNEATMTLSEFKSAVDALPKKLTIDDKSRVNALAVELTYQGNFNGREIYEKKINDAKTEISNLEASVQALGQDIWDQIDPLRVSQADGDNVKSLMKRYQSFADADRVHVPNKDDLLAAYDIVKNLDNGIITQKVFENVKYTKETFTYTGSAGDNADYTMSIAGDNVSLSGDMKAGIRLSNSTGVSVPSGAFGFYMEQNGKLAGTFDVKLKCDLGAGEYMLYHIDFSTGKPVGLGKVTVKDGYLNFTTNVGGDFYVDTVKTDDPNDDNKQQSGGNSNLQGGSGSKNSGNGAKASQETESNTIEAQPRNGVIKASDFEAIQDKDKNLRYEGTTEDGKKYTLIFNGKDIKNPMDVHVGLSLSGENDEYIRQLSEDPMILHFEHSGQLPGNMYVEVETDKEDGEYLLFSYNADEMKAEFIQKVEVKDGSVKFIIDHCSDYFIDLRAKAKSLKTEAADEGEETDAGALMSAAAEAAPLSENTETEKEDDHIVAIVVICCIIAVIMIALIVFIVKKKKEDNKNFDQLKKGEIRSEK